MFFLDAYIYIKENNLKRIQKTMKNILAENLLRFGVKNLNEKDKAVLSEAILLEQSQEAKNALAALNNYLKTNPFTSSRYEGRSRGTAEMTSERDIEIIKIRQQNPAAPNVSWYCKFYNRGNIDPTTKVFKLEKIELTMFLTDATMDAYEKLAPGFKQRADQESSTVASTYIGSVAVSVKATDTVATVETNIRKYWPGLIDRNMLSTMLTLYGVKA
jgi:hypothetical protein